VVSLQASNGTGLVALDAPIPTGTNSIGTVRVVGNAGATVDGTVGGALPTNAIATTEVPSTQAGAAMSVKTLNGVAAATNIKASAGNLYGFAIVNASAATGFIQFFNTSTTTTAAPVLIIPVGSTAPSNMVYVSPGSKALANFSTGIAINCATTVGGVTSLSTVTGTVFYS
jgi:hypothetical protein